ncbi:unnamed protein product [Caenorhabditis brenneri]
MGLHDSGRSQQGSSTGIHRCSLATQHWIDPPKPLSTNIFDPGHTDTDFHGSSFSSCIHVSGFLNDDFLDELKHSSFSQSCKTLPGQAASNDSQRCSLAVTGRSLAFLAVVLTKRSYPLLCSWPLVDSDETSAFRTILLLYFVEVSKRMMLLATA